MFLEKNNILKLVKILCSGVGAAGATFLLQIFLSHKLSLNQFGVYVSANSSLTMIGPFVGMGIGGLFLRKVCLEENRLNYYFLIAVKCLIINVFIAFAVSQLIFMNIGLNFRLGIFLSSYYLAVPFQYLIIANAQASDNFFEVSLAQILNPGLRIILVLFLFFMLPSLDHAIILLSLANILTFLIFFRVIKQHFSVKVFSLKQTKNQFFAFFKESFFYSFNGTINVIQIQFSVLIAMCFFGAKTSGLYSSAITLLTACYILPNILFGTYLLPQYHKLEKTILKKRSFKHGVAAFIVGAVFSLVIYISSDFIIKLFYPDTFQCAALLLKILTISLPFRFYSTAIGAALLNEKCIKYKVLASFLSFGIQIILIFLLKGSGIKSISISFVLSEMMTSILYHIIFYNYFKKQ